MVQERTLTANNESSSVAYDHTWTGEISGPDSANEAFTASEAPVRQHGTLALDANGSFTYTPKRSYQGSDSFSYDVNNGGETLTNYDFGELLPVSLNGTDYLLPNTTTPGSLTTTTTGVPIPGTTVVLTGTDADDDPVSDTTTTDSSGAYSFTGLTPSNGAGYTVTETPPASDAHLGQTSTTTGATTITQSGTHWAVSNIVLDNSDSPSTDNFFETASRANASLSGVVYIDANNNGKPDKGEPDLGGVTVILSGTNNQGSQITATAVTEADGSYNFQQLYPGTYSITEIDPTGYVDAKDTIGTAGGTVGHDTFTAIDLGLGADGTGYDFGWERAPVFTSTPLTFAGAGNPYNYQATATDADGDALTYSLLEGPAGMTVNQTTGAVSWAPDAGDVGTHPIDVQVSDGRGGFDQQGYTLAVNPAGYYLPPYFTSTPVVSTVVGTPYKYQATAIDPNGLGLTFSYAGPAGLTVNGSTGAVSWTPTAAELAHVWGTQVLRAMAARWDSTIFSAFFVRRPARFSGMA